MFLHSFCLLLVVCVVRLVRPTTRKQLVKIYSRLLFSIRFHRAVFIYVYMQLALFR